MRRDTRELPPRGMTGLESAFWTHSEALLTACQDRGWDEGEMMVNRLRGLFRQMVATRAAGSHGFSA